MKFSFLRPICIFGNLQNTTQIGGYKVNFDFYDSHKDDTNAVIYNTQATLEQSWLFTGKLSRSFITNSDYLSYMGTRWSQWYQLVRIGKVAKEMQDSDSELRKMTYLEGRILSQ